MTKHTNNRRSRLLYCILFLGPLLFCSFIGQSIEFTDPHVDAPLFFSLYGLIVSVFVVSLVYVIDQSGNGRLIGILPIGVFGFGLMLLSLMKGNLAVLTSAGSIIVIGVCYAGFCFLRKT